MLPGFENIPGLSARAAERAHLFVLLINAHTGEERIKSPEIEKRLELCGSEVRAIVSYLRCQSFPIGSDTNGYFLATKPEEIEQTIEQLEGRAKKIMVCVNGLKQWRNLKTTGASAQMDMKL